MSKHSITIRGLRVVTTCWSWAWSNRTPPSKWARLGSPLAASSVYGDLTCSVHTVNNLCMFNCQCHFYRCNRGSYVRLAFVPNMLSSWNKDIIIIIIMGSWGPKLSSYGERRLWSDWVDVQADLSLRWAHMPFCWFCNEAAQIVVNCCN